MSASTFMVAARPTVPAHAERAHKAPSQQLTWGVFVMSVTAILLGSFIGSIGAFAFLGLWILLFLAYGRGCLRLLLSAPPLLWSLPLLAVASTLWSQAPSDSMKFGGEFLATALCAVLAASLLKPRQFISALTCCLVLIAIMSVLFGKVSTDPLTGSSAFVGVFESKNQLGFFVSMMMLAALALLLDGKQGMAFRLLGLASLILSLPLLVKTRSGTAILTVALSAAVVIVNLALSRLNRFERARLLSVAAIVSLPIALLMVVAGDDMTTLLLGAMGKDATLTGRTLLWQHAMALIPNHPLFGYGYQAFWKQNAVEPESLWFEFHVLSRQGFHFHSTYMEIAVELGYVGAGVLVATLLGVFGGLLRWSWRTGTTSASFFTALMFNLLTRSFVEVDMLQQFQIGGFLLFAAGAYAARAPSGDDA